MLRRRYDDAVRGVGQRAAPPAGLKPIPYFRVEARESRDMKMNLTSLDNRGAESTWQTLWV